MTLFFIALLAGILTVLAPCVLPLIPIIVGGSVSGEPSMKRALRVTASLGASVILFTFLLKASTIFIHIPESFWQWFSGSIIIIFGLATLFPGVWDRLPIVGKLSTNANRTLAIGHKKKGLLGDMIVGASLGPVFATCSPTYFIILATVLPVKPFLGFIYLLTYTIGLCVSLLIIARVGQKVIVKLSSAADPYGPFKKILGALFLLIGILIVSGVDKTIESYITAKGFFDVTKIEQGLLQRSQSNTSPVYTDTIATSTDTTSPTTSTSAIKKTPSKTIKRSFGPAAPEITNPSGFVNTGGMPITISQFKGKKVVLVDIWTYSCINCQRTIPYIVDWYTKYKDAGLEVIGIHTPEFAFEKLQTNVENATKKFKIEYPVVMDNDFGTWNAFGNQYWPRKYLINIDGQIVYDHIGEGGYEETEKKIQELLQERKEVLGDSVRISQTTVDHSYTTESQSPETYFGFARNTTLANGAPKQSGIQTLTRPTSIDSNKLYLTGTWDFQSEKAISKSTSSIIFKYNAKNVYFVANADTPMKIRILRDGVPVTESGGEVTVSQAQLYTLISEKTAGEHTIEIIIDGPGLEAFTFTFG